MAQAAFDWADFLAPLSPLVITMSLILGVTVGGIIANLDVRRGPAHLYWMVAGGTIFFVPLSIIRALEGSPIWERFLATLVLWLVYILGIAIGELVYARFRK